MAKPDVVCWIKVINITTGEAVPDGGVVFPPANVVVRYVVANDSNVAAGPLTVVGSLHKDGIQQGRPNVVPAQQITVQPGTVWMQEVSVSQGTLFSQYVAKIIGDVGNFVKEEDEANNLAQRSFTLIVST
jgi:hypothetical protein